MKVRTDFVTNSSSSSFVTVYVNTLKNEIYDLSRESIEAFNLESMPWHEGYSMPSLIDGKLMTYTSITNEKDDMFEVSSIVQLAAIIFFEEISAFGIESVVLKHLLIPVFEFLCGYQDKEYIIARLNEACVDGFEELIESINAVDSNKDIMQCINVFLESNDMAPMKFKSVFFAKDIEKYRIFISKVADIRDIQSLSVTKIGEYWGEFLDGKPDDVEDCYKEEIKYVFNYYK